jgi:hypothetical protein
VDKRVKGRLLAPRANLYFSLLFDLFVCFLFTRQLFNRQTVKTEQEEDLKTSVNTSPVTQLHMS